MWRELTFSDKVSEIQFGLDLFVVCQMGVLGEHATKLAEEVVVGIRVVSS